MTAQLRVAFAWAARLAITLAYLPLRLLPRGDGIVMLSRQSDTIPRDFELLREGLRTAAPGIKVTIQARRMGRGARGALRYVPTLARQLFLIARARVIVLDTYNIPVSVLRLGSGVRVVQIWHALGAFKKFGLSSLGQAGGRDARIAQVMRMHQGYDLVTVSAEPARRGFAEALGVTTDQVAVAPLPRVDDLRDSAWQTATRARLLAADPRLAAGPVVLFAPTLDRTGAGFGIDVQAMAAAATSAGWRLVLAPHPLMRSAVPTELLPAIPASTQELLTVADLFVTDFSSAIFEAGVVGVPSILLVPPTARRLDNLFVVPWDQPDAVIASESELAAVLANPKHASRAAGTQFAQSFVDLGACEEVQGGATGQLTRIVLEQWKLARAKARASANAQ